MKKETPEEVAERILANNIDGLKDALKDDDLFFFYKGVICCYGVAMAESEQIKQDEFAIAFTDWCEEHYFPSSVKGVWFDNPDFDNAKRFLTIELLQIYKNK